MTAVDWLAIVGGTTALMWVNWYFFLAERTRAARAKGAVPAQGTGGPTSPNRPTPGRGRA
jgi:hypothetical protein